MISNDQGPERKNPRALLTISFFLLTSTALPVAIDSGNGALAAPPTNEDPAIESRMFALKEIMYRLEFDKNRIETPPDHAIWRSVWKMPLCVTMGAETNGAFSISKELRIGASAGANFFDFVKAKVRAAGLKESRGATSLGLDFQLHACADLMAYAQFLHYRDFNDSPGEITGRPDEEFFADSSFYEELYPSQSNNRPTTQERIAWANNSEPDPADRLSVNSKAFLKTLYDLSQTDPVSGAALSPQNTPMVRNQALAAQAIFSDGVYQGGELLLNNVGKASALVDNIYQLASGNPVTIVEQLGDEISNMIPAGNVIDLASDAFNNFSVTDLNGCAVRDIADYTQLPDVIQSTLDSTCIDPESLDIPFNYDEYLWNASVDGLDQLDNIVATLDGANDRIFNLELSTGNLASVVHQLWLWSNGLKLNFEAFNNDWIEPLWDRIMTPAFKYLDDRL